MNADGLNNHLPTPIGGVDEEHLSIPVNQISNHPINQISPDANNVQNNHSDGGQSVFSLNPLTAEDDDLIEKEWVHRLDKAVSSNHDDPYMQLQEISSIKSDYLKKRFNKITQNGAK